MVGILMRWAGGSGLIIQLDLFENHIHQSDFFPYDLLS